MSLAAPVSSQHSSSNLIPVSVARLFKANAGVWLILNSLFSFTDFNGGSAPFNNNSGDHIQVQTVSSEGVVTEIINTQNVTIRTDDSGATFGFLWIDYCYGVLDVYISNNNDGTTKPSIPTVSAAVNIEQLFSGSDVFLGFTAATGGESDFHDILAWTFSLEETCSV
jgi:Legume lectin domain